MAKRLITLDYDAVRTAFDEEFRATRKLIESGETHLDNLAEGFTEADRVLRKMLTEDVVEVVRCKDCVHYDERGREYGYCYHWDYEQGMSPNCVDADDFCSYGEKRCE